MLRKQAKSKKNNHKKPGQSNKSPVLLQGSEILSTILTALQNSRINYI